MIQRYIGQRPPGPRCRIYVHIDADFGAGPRNAAVYTRILGSERSHGHNGIKFEPGPRARKSAPILALVLDIFSFTRRFAGKTMDIKAATCEGQESSGPDCAVQYIFS
jgi:hypothetical protein